MTISILIVGAGAVGAFYASRLAQVPDTQVSVICRSNYAAVKASGFYITSPKYGDYTFIPHRVFATPEDARRSQINWDFILVSTKALPDVSDDSAILAGLVRPETAIVLVQNGLGVEEPYARRFPDALLLSAVTIVSAAQNAPGKITHNRWTRISVGPYLVEGCGADAERAGTVANERLVELLRAGGVGDAEAYSPAKLQLLRWHKVAINAAMNPSSVLSGGSSNHDMVSDAELHVHLKGVMDEVLSTAARVHGQALPVEFATAEAVLRSTMKNSSGSRPSMALDWQAGKRMELEVILGAPIRIARAKGVEMPRLQSMYALLKMAQTNREASLQEGKGKGKGKL